MMKRVDAEGTTRTVLCPFDAIGCVYVLTVLAMAWMTVGVAAYALWYSFTGPFFLWPIAIGTGWSVTYVYVSCTYREFTPHEDPHVRARNQWN